MLEELSSSVVSRCAVLCLCFGQENQVETKAKVDVRLIAIPNYDDRMVYIGPSFEASPSVYKGKLVQACARETRRGKERDIKLILFGKRVSVHST
jgi:hypothetical protein